MSVERVEVKLGQLAVLNHDSQRVPAFMEKDVQRENRQA